MNKNIFFLLITLSTPVFAMENNNSRPGDIAIKNHPKAWLATKIIGGSTGAFVGLMGIAALHAAADLTLNIAARSASNKKINLLKFLALSLPITYAGWKGGEAVTTTAWYPTWYGIDKLQKIKNTINNQ